MQRPAVVERGPARLQFDGDLVVADRRLLTYDLAQILSEADAIAAELVDLSRGGTIQHYAP